MLRLLLLVLVSLACSPRGDDVAADLPAAACPTPATPPHHPLVPPLWTPCRPLCSPFDTIKGRLMLGAMAGSAGGMLLTSILERTEDAQRRQTLQFALVFW